MRTRSLISKHTQTQKHLLNLKPSKLKNSLFYSFKFASIISPGSIKNMTLVNRASSRTSNNSLYVKQSYVMLTWMAYIREVQVKQKRKSDESDSDELQPSFFVFPCNRSRLTFLKAPMAHKTFSQEQFLTKTYTLSISFNNNFRHNSVVGGVNNSMFLALSLRQNNLPFESNLMFLKKLKMSLTCSDSGYMTIR